MANQRTYDIPQSDVENAEDLIRETAVQTVFLRRSGYFTVAGSYL
jgi:hypothetical protein